MYKLQPLRILSPFRQCYTAADRIDIAWHGLQVETDGNIYQGQNIALAAIYYDVETQIFKFFIGMHNCDGFMFYEGIYYKIYRIINCVPVGGAWDNAQITYGVREVLGSLLVIPEITQIKITVAQLCKRLTNNMDL